MYSQCLKKICTDNQTPKQKLPWKKQLRKHLERMRVKKSLTCVLQVKWLVTCISGIVSVCTLPWSTAQPSTGSVNGRWRLCWRWPTNTSVRCHWAVRRRWVVSLVQGFPPLFVLPSFLPNPYLFPLFSPPPPPPCLLFPSCLWLPPLLHSTIHLPPYPLCLLKYWHPFDNKKYSNWKV